jgi:prevent-host-death family protein
VHKTYIVYMSAVHDDFEMNVSEARSQLPKILDVVNEGGRVYLVRNGRRVGAVVPVELAEHQDEIEDEYWSQRAARVLAKGESTVPWEEAVAALESGTADQQ